MVLARGAHRRHVRLEDRFTRVDAHLYTCEENLDNEHMADACLEVHAAVGAVRAVINALNLYT